MPRPLVSWASLVQATTNWPASFMPIAGASWKPPVVVLTTDQLPIAAPAAV
jgi:hypothetical protein